MKKENIIGIRETPNYGKVSIKEKINKRIRSLLINLISDTKFQFVTYFSFWHYKLNQNRFEDNFVKEHYLTLKPDYGAGIGHQLSNWNTGFYFSKYFNVKFAHMPFSSPIWEDVLGFGEDEVEANHIVKNSKFKKVRLPKFDSGNVKHLKLIKAIISSYKNEKILFLLELNQGYIKQCDTAHELSVKYFMAKSRIKDIIIFDESKFNIAIHIRRRMIIENDEVWKERGLDNNYYSNILKAVLKNSKKRDTVIYLFSQGEIFEFPEFSEFQNFHFCLDMDPFQTFQHLIKADLLISSKSSFSYKPALISKGIKICPKTFWHEYPKTSDFILADNLGNFNEEDLKKNIKK